jgi:hypothetical protein
LLRRQATLEMWLSNMLTEEAGDTECAIRADCPDRPGRSSEAILHISHGERRLKHAPIGEGTPAT